MLELEGGILQFTDSRDHFLLVNLTAGWRAAVGAMIAEWVYRTLTSGFFGAIAETLGETEPEWQGAAAAMLVLPVMSHSIEFLVHWLCNTPHLRGQHHLFDELYRRLDAV